MDEIKVGDYVNGEHIKDKWYDYANECYHLVTKANEHIFVEDIKSIVTKEQFANIEYKVEE